MWIREFVVHGRRNEDLPVKPGKHIHGFDQDKIIERRGVGNNRGHLQTELVVRVAVSFEVFQGVFQLDAVVLQKRVDFETRLKTEQTSQKGSSDFAGAVGFEGQSFQSGARQVLAVSGESRKKLIGKRDGDLLHGFRIPEELCESTSLELGGGSG